jgi:SAM-dependent methyltransferase
MPERDVAAEIYPEILNVDITPALARSVKDFVSSIRRPIPWRTFSRIPGGQRETSRVRSVLDRWKTLVPGQRNAFFQEASTHTHRLQKLEADDALLFHLLCLSGPVPRAAVERFVGGANVEHFLELGVLLERDDRLLLPISLVPFDDGYYLAESRHIFKNRTAYGIGPAFIGEGTDDVVLFLRKFARRRRIRSMLEMGCGIGIVALEMQRLIPSREGADIYERNVAFAAANKELKADQAVRFYKSDLFSHVKGKFDLIVFNPWTPTWRYLDLVSRFMTEAPHFLNEGGAIALFVNTSQDDGGDSTLEKIASVMSEQSLIAQRYISHSYFDRAEGRITLFSASFLVIQRLSESAPPHRGHPIRTAFNVSQASFAARWFVRRPLERIFP